MNRTYVIIRPPGRDFEEALRVIRAEPRAQLLDHADSKALLIKAPDEVVETLGRRLKGWKIALETRVSAPAPPSPRTRWKIS